MLKGTGPENDHYCSDKQTKKEESRWLIGQSNKPNPRETKPQLHFVTVKEFTWLRCVAIFFYLWVYEASVWFMSISDCYTVHHFCEVFWGLFCLKWQDSGYELESSPQPPRQGHCLCAWGICHGALPTELLDAPCKSFLLGSTLWWTIHWISHKQTFLMSYFMYKHVSQ